MSFEALEALRADTEGVSVESPSPASVGCIAKTNYSHDGMIDMIIANPGVSQNEIARQLGYSASWVSLVMSSDVFQNRLQERTNEVIDPALRATLKERFDGIIARSIEILNAKLAAEPELVPDGLALRAFELATRAAGYGGRAAEPPSQTVNVEVHLESLGDNLTKLLERRKSAALEQQPLETDE